jgi:hypothetical protein
MSSTISIIPSSFECEGITYILLGEEDQQFYSTNVSTELDDTPTDFTVFPQPSVIRRQYHPTLVNIFRRINGRITKTNETIMTPSTPYSWVPLIINNKTIWYTECEVGGLFPTNPL